MKNDQNRKARCVLMLPNLAPNMVGDIESGKIPRERLVGFYELRERGWEVTVSDARWQGSIAGFRRKLKRFLQVPSWKALREWGGADVVIVKDDFSVVLTILAKMLRKKIVYMDSMFVMPQSRFRRSIVKFNLIYSDVILCFSSEQAKLWAKEFGVSVDRFKVLKYSMDGDFYPRINTARSEGKDVVISVGRDLGRDFGTLVEAARNKPLSVKIVTLPYLVPSSAYHTENVEVSQHLSYTQLFELFSMASLVVVPLRPGISYPSGIRAVMEAMLVGLPVVASYTPVLDEYFQNGKELVLVEPGSVQELEAAIDKILGNSEFRNQLVMNARERLERDYLLGNCTDQLEEVFEEL